MAVPPAEVDVHENVVPVVSTVTVPSSHGVAADSGSWTFHVTVTFDVYQPFEPAVPLTTGVITGGVRSSVLGRHSHAPRYGLDPSAACATARLAENQGYEYEAPPTSRSVAVQPLTHASVDE